MLRLGTNRGPRWLTLNKANGVRVRVRAATTAIMEGCRIRASAMAVQIVEEAKAIVDAGGRVEDMPDLADPAAVSGLSQQCYIQALATFAIVEWEGIAAEDGTSAPLTDDNVTHFFRDYPDEAATFMAQYFKPHGDAITEGNGSGVGRSGTSDPAPDTAGNAEN